MGLFDKIKGPIFYKDDSEAQKKLEVLQQFLTTVRGDAADAVKQEIRLIEAGIAGEKQVRFELESSHIPMFVLHDLFLEHDGLTAQIDYLIITRKHQFVIECKNLYGDIEINSSGDFIRTFSYGRHSKREGIYSPITQNRRHLELIKQIRGEEKNALVRTIFEKIFYDNYRSVIVLSNPKTVLNAKYAKKEIRDQVIRADQLIEHIRSIDADPNSVNRNEKVMEELAKFFLNAHKQVTVDYTEKFRAMSKPSPSAVEKAVPSRAAANKTVSAEARNTVICPKCGAPMVKRQASKGSNAGNEFYGCSKYPKCRGIVNIQKQE